MLHPGMLFYIIEHMYSLPLQNNKQIVFLTLQQSETYTHGLEIYPNAAQIIEMQIIISYLLKTIIHKHVKYFLHLTRGDSTILEVGNTK